MTTRVPDTRKHKGSGETSRASALWTLASAGGALLGGAVALRLFPEAGFARNPTGVFGWHLVGFALAIGLGFAMAQSLVLTSLLRRRSLTSSLCRHLWLPLSAAGIAGMILPLWWSSAWLFIMQPLAVLGPMLPGIVLLGMVQGGLVRCLGGQGMSWALRTMLGAAVGAVAGLFAAFAFSVAAAALIPLEPIWAAVTAGVIGALQGRLLDKGLLRDRS